MNENPPQLGRPASPAAEWALDPTITYLNHGSFGACMRAILDVQQGWRTKLETHPTRFLARDLEDLLDWARSEFASFVGIDSDDLALVSNTTAAINTVLRSLHFDRGDEVLATDHAYNSCTNALRYVAAKDGAKVVLARIPFPLNHELAVAARDLLCEAMHTAVPAPPEMIGSMASIFLPGGPWSREDLASRMETIESAL